MAIRVLVADDAPFIREILGHLLTRAGFELCGEAVDGNDVVWKARELRPQVIIMDIVMPRKSGLEATKVILAEQPEMRIIACSTEGSEAMVAHAIEAGCCDFITKPFKNDQVIETIKKAVNKGEGHG